MKSTSYIVIIIGLAVALGLGQRAGAAPQSISVTNPASNVTFDEADEYATLVWNDPWDMSQALDIRQLDSPRYVYPNHFNPFTPCASGLWCGQVRSDVGNPDLFLLTPGYPGGLHVGRDGNLRPINAGQYKRLTFRMWLDQVPAGSVGWQVMWTNGTVADFCNPATCGQSVFFPLYQGWNIYSVDLSTSRLSGMAWSGNLTGLRFDAGLNNMQNRVVYLDWARLTGPNGDNRPIGWNTTEGGNVTVEFKSSDGATTPYRPVFNSASVGRLQTITAGSGSHTFQGSLPPGDWQVGVLSASNSFGLSPGHWLVQAAPTLTFVRPSYTSGADYATVVKGNPWDMNDAADVGGGVVNAQNPQFINGILSATSDPTSAPTSDPQIWFLTNPLPPNFNIDTNRFRYATFRLKVDGVPDISNGSVARLIWPYAPCGVSNDIPLHADWNTVSLDLWDNNILDSQSGPGCTSGWRAVGSRTELRLDPHEIPAATTFYLDYFLLTAMDTGRTSGYFPIEYILGNSNDRVTFYYNTSRSLSGRQPAQGSNQAAVTIRGGLKMFLPLMMKQLPVSSVPGAKTYLWSLAGVGPNTYYISADVTDGRKTVTWISDTPVVVTP